MARFLVDLWLDGYDTDQEADSACEAFIFENLDFSASSVKVTRISDEVYDEAMKRSKE